MMQRFRGAHFSAYIIGPALGALVVLGVGPTIPTWDNIFWRWHDAWNPIATITARKLPSPTGEIRAEFTVVRHRDECKVIQAAAIEEIAGGNAVRVFAARVDAQPLINVPRGVTFHSEWRFWPTGIGTLRVVMEYTCDGRIVTVPVKGL